VEIVDARVHLNQLVPDWQTADMDRVLQAGIGRMDAVGISAVLIARAVRQVSRWSAASTTGQVSERTPVTVVLVLATRRAMSKQTIRSLR
jgi:hypothetical protein